jgi:protein-disulfide isomerase
MRRLRTALLLLAMPVVLHAAPPAKAPAGKVPSRAAARDWSRTIVATPDGGFRMGNPAAKIKLVEFGSLTCHVCEAFSREGYRPLVQYYVKRGTVSYEFRNFTREAYDLSAAMVSNCAGPQNFFPLTEQIFATRVEWLKRFDAIPRDQMEQIEKLDTAARLQRLADVGGLTAMARRYGVTPARAKACLADPKGLEKLMGVRRVALTQFDLEGTPTFVINGEKARATSWEGLEPVLKALGG